MRRAVANHEVTCERSQTHRRGRSSIFSTFTPSDPPDELVSILSRFPGQAKLTGFEEAACDDVVANQCFYALLQRFPQAHRRAEAFALLAYSCTLPLRSFHWRGAETHHRGTIGRE